MRRLLRWVFNLFGAESALLFVGACVFWVRSYSRQDTAMHLRGDASLGPSRFKGCYSLYGNTGSFWTFASSQGKVVVTRVSFHAAPRAGFYLPGPSVPGQSTWIGLMPPNQALTEDRTVGASHWGYDWQSYSGDMFVVPYGTVALLALSLPLCWIFILLLRRLRSGAGLCPACGYDLRESIGRCPQCGAVRAEPARANGGRDLRRRGPVGHPDEVQKGQP